MGLLNAPNLQPKLLIGAPNDQYEQEANRVAHAVMRMPDQRYSVRADASNHVRRQPGEEEEEMLQTKAEPGRAPTLNAGLESSLRSAGP